VTTHHLVANHLVTITDGTAVVTSPSLKGSDIHNAVTFLANSGAVEPGRIAVLGVCASSRAA
jgi:dienelactone hydrolase